MYMPQIEHLFERSLEYLPGELIILVLLVQVVFTVLAWYGADAPLMVARSAFPVIIVALVGRILFYMMVTFYPAQASGASLAAQSRILICIQAVASVILLKNFWLSALREVTRGRID